MENSERRKAFEDLKYKIHPKYDCDFLEKEGDVLILIMSPNPKFALRKYDFKHSCIFLADKSLGYYTHNPARQVLLLKSFFDLVNFKKILFLGSSKGGYGALLWASLIGQFDCGFKIGVICFSPQTLLYPLNENLIKLPSYLGNLKKMELDDSHRVNFIKYGSLLGFLERNKFLSKIIFSEKNKMDAAEVFRVASIKNISFFEFLPLPLAFHGAITPYIIDTNDKKSVNRLADKIFADAEIDSDLKSQIPEKKEDFCKFFESISVGSLNDCVEDFLINKIN